jgi:hypothetical protein
MGAVEGCFFKMEKRERTMKAKPMLMAAEANRLCGFIFWHTHKNRESETEISM